MKTIFSQSYKISQQQTIRFDPSMLKAPQNNPRIQAFQNAFRTLNMQGITAMTQNDAFVLRDIQGQIRQKLRFFRVDPGF